MISCFNKYMQSLFIYLFSYIFLIKRMWRINNVTQFIASIFISLSAVLIYDFHMVILTVSSILKRVWFPKEIKKNVQSALFSDMSTREFLRTREKCGEARAEGECFSHFSSVLKNSQVFIELNNLFYFFYYCIVNCARSYR